MVFVANAIFKMVFGILGYIYIDIAPSTEQTHERYNNHADILSKNWISPQG